MSSTVFISYLEEANEFVKEVLVRELAAAGYPHWYDSVRLRQEDTTNQTIEQALSKSFAVIIVSSTSTHHTAQMHIEYAFARTHKNLKTIRIILDSTVSDDTQVDFELDLVNQKDHQLHQLIEYMHRITRHHQPQPQTVYPAYQEEQEEAPPVDHIIDTFELPSTDDHDLFLEAALQSLKAHDVTERCDAARYLGDAGVREAVPPLLETLKECSPRVCKAAVEALGKIKDPRAIPGLATVLHNQNVESDLRESAAKAMGNIGDADAIPALIQAMNTDNEMYVRLTAARALGTIGDSRALSALAKTLHTARWHQLRCTAIYSLGEIGDISSHWDLLEALGDDYEEVRHAAATVIINLLGPTGIKAALYHADWRMREAAAWALGETRSPGIVPDLIEALTDADRAVRKSAVWALGCIADERAVPELLQRLRLDTNPRVLQLTVWALGEIGSVEAVSSITRMLDKRNEDIREAAVAALSKIADSCTVPGLLEALVDSNESIQIAAAQALGKLAHPDAFEALRAALWNAPSTAVQCEAIKALACIPDSRALTVLEQALEEDSPEVRQCAEQALLEIGTPKALDIVNRWRRSY